MDKQHHLLAVAGDTIDPHGEPMRGLVGRQALRRQAAAVDCPALHH